MLCRGGIQLKQISLGLGPKFIPPQLPHGGVGGGVHGVAGHDVLLACGGSGVAKGEDGCDGGNHWSPFTESLH